MAKGSSKARDGQLMGPLLDYLARRMRAEAELELHGFGVRPRHVVALTLLRDFGERSQSDLADAIGIDPTNLVALLNDLESTGLVERRRSTADRRRHTVQLTSSGARELAAIEHTLAAIEDRLLTTLTAAERATLYGLLQRVAADIAGGPEESAIGG